LATARPDDPAPMMQNFSSVDEWKAIPGRGK
jgi:hypothetical protein